MRSRKTIVLQSNGTSMSQTTLDNRRDSASHFERLFTEHPREVGESYFEHFGMAMGFGFKLLGLAGAAFIHGLIPGLHKATVSKTVCLMAKDMGYRADEARETRMRDAGVWDVGL